MFDRRRRVLDEAQAMLSEVGVEGFTIRELSRRADVAQRTLYNLFGSKEDIIASAMQQHFAELLAQMPPPPRGNDLEGALGRIDFVADHAIKVRRYSTAMVAVFFSPSVDRRIYETLRWISERGSGAWLAQAAAEGLLPKISGEDLERLATLLVNASYATVTDWAAGRISDEEAKIRFKFNQLVCLLPFLTGPLRTTAQRLLERVRRGESF